MPRGKVMKVKDFGGDVQEKTEKKKKLSAKKKVANNNVLELVKQWKVLDEQEKSIKKRKDALRTAIMELSAKDGQSDAIGNIYAKYDRFNVKHEVRKTVKLRGFDEVPTEFYREHGIVPEDITDSVTVLDEGKIEQLIEEGKLTKDDVESFLLKISTSTALKITEDEPNDNDD